VIVGAGSTLGTLIVSSDGGAGGGGDLITGLGVDLSSMELLFSS
jgi:hypothetical protein